MVQNRCSGEFTLPKRFPSSLHVAEMMMTTFSPGIGRSLCKLNACSHSKLRTIREGVMKITSGVIVALDTTQRRLEEARDAVEEADGAELDKSPVLLLPSSSTFSGASSSGASPSLDSFEWLVSENEDDAAVAPDSVGTYPLLAQD